MTPPRHLNKHYQNSRTLGVLLHYNMSLFLRIDLLHIALLLSVYASATLSHDLNERITIPKSKCSSQSTSIFQRIPERSTRPERSITLVLAVV